MTNSKFVHRCADCRKGQLLRGPRKKFHSGRIMWFAVSWGIPHDSGEYR